MGSIPSPGITRLMTDLTVVISYLKKQICQWHPDLRFREGNRTSILPGSGEDTGTLLIIAFDILTKNK
jgi:hypothetical protein